MCVSVSGKEVCIVGGQFFQFMNILCNSFSSRVVRPLLLHQSQGNITLTETKCCQAIAIAPEPR